MILLSLYRPESVAVSTYKVTLLYFFQDSFETQFIADHP